MAGTLTIPENMNVGGTLIVTGTGFANSHAYTIAVSFPGKKSPDVLYGGTTSGGGAVDATDKLELTMNEEGVVNISVDDGSAVVTGSTRVWRT